MLLIRSVQGEVLVTIELASFLDTLAEGSSLVRALKQHLYGLCGLPRFRQPLIVLDDGLVLNDTDDDYILKPGDVQLVLLDFSSTSELQRDELRRAAESGLKSVAETMLHKQQDPDLGDPAQLFVASENGHVEVARLLLEAKADKDKAEADMGKATNLGDTPLFIASLTGQLEVVRLLLEANADKDKATNDGATRLHFAADQGHLEVSRLLLEPKAGKDKATNEGETPLFFTAGRGQLEVARLLLESKADKDKPRTMAINDGATPLHSAADKGPLEVARLLLESKADKDKAMNDGATTLHVAACRGKLEVARLLLESKADKDKAQIAGANPLIIAADQGTWKLHAFCWRPRRKWTRQRMMDSLHCATWQGHSQGFHLHLNLGSKVPRAGARELWRHYGNGRAQLNEATLSLWP
eukprot:s206_g7.t1